MSVLLKLPSGKVSLSRLLADRLKLYRNLQHAAQETGLDASTLSRVRAGREPDLYTFGVLLEWLKVGPVEGVRVTADDDSAWRKK